MQNKVQSVFAVLVASILFTACGGETRTRPQTCSSDAQCTGGNVCKSGTCQTPSSGTTGACTKSSDCAAGEVCDAGECVANDGSGACTTAMDCPEDQYCQAGSCTGGDTTDTGTTCATDDDCDGGKCNSSKHCVDCLTNSDCSSGQTCSRAQTCTGTTTSCGSDADCANGTRCKLAVNPKICVQCIEDSDCARSARSTTRGSSAKVCRDNVCTNPTTTCSSNADCGNFVCASNQCTACTSSSQCSNGATCDTSTGNCGSGTGCSTAADCGGVACQNGTCEKCTNDSQCTGTGKPLCEPTSGKCIATECTTAADCDAGEGCYTPGRCGPCVADGECRSGEYCYIAPSDTTGWCYAGTAGSCTTNAQCASDLVCYNKQCTTCLSTSECDSGETCSWTGRCTGGSTGGGATCTSNTQCAWNQTCVNGNCATNPNTGGGSGQFGSTCTNTSQCAYGLSCAGLTYDTSICTSVCVGAGNGGHDDCPSGYACVDWEDTTLDGLKFCMSKVQLGPQALGYPFTTPPGGSCNSNESNTCQTSYCDIDQNGNGTCARLCTGNIDCGSGNVCWANPVQNYGYVHECVIADSSLGQQGEGCSQNAECDSGVCVGRCEDRQTPCGNSADCTGIGGGSCSGTCSNHCSSIAECVDGSSCNFWPMYVSGGVYSGWTPVCTGAIYYDVGQHLGLGQACGSDADCDSEWCIDGACTTPCGSQDDCSYNGTGCIPVNFYSGATPVYSGSFCL